MSKIEWTEKVWNPTTGCNKVSPGCKNCYAEGMHKRLTGMGQDKYSRPFLDGAFPHEKSLYVPMNWKKPKMVFVNSMSDLFHESVPDEYIAKVFAIMALCKQHTFQVLTKRPERMMQFMNKSADQFTIMLMNAIYKTDLPIGDEIDQYTLAVQLCTYVATNFPLPNVWLGTSCENQVVAQDRIPLLIQTRSAVHWISAEPLLGPIDFTKIPAAAGLNWIVVGGESGRKKRPFEIDWARSIRDYCYDMEIAFFMKQIDKVQQIPSTLLIREYPNENIKQKRAALGSVQNDQSCS